jgi:hypothetical protein
VNVTIENEGGVGEAPANRLLQIISAYEGRLGTALPGAEPQVRSGRGGTYASVIRQFGGERGILHAFVTSGQSSAVCHIRVPTSGYNKEVVATAMNACSSELKSAQPVTSAKSLPPQKAGEQAPAAPVAASQSASPVEASQPARFAQNWAAVEGVYFQVTYIVGAGGMPMPDYEPVILFRDGSYYEIDEAALEDVDLAAEKQQHPKRWGHWRLSGEQYALTRSDGRTENWKLQDGSFFRAFGADANGGQLSGRYKRVSGGGNSALGGSVMVGISSQYSFAPGGQFTGGSTVNASNSGGSTGVSSVTGANRSLAGAYQLDRFTITMRQPNGRVERQFFAFGSQGKPARLDTAMIFLGSRTYVVD